MECHLGYRGNYTWSNEEIAVTEAVDVKILFIEIIYSFCSNLGCGCELLSAVVFAFSRVGVDQLKIGQTKLEEAIKSKN